ncbi:LOW QUALITY PROTEIN: uncharacterized protein LOC108089532 [Drosophila ficusphila]|uniref:LOW QUALITY PROTEIN: uncharacterized protein LOC108089532 n=1 Tax=Drosophila ficusphila TaxID=30025 RepID=UPI0007E832C2|nr:LOW QUALITY PROTEIN: uncharacterized protein LOC108089532 [Drosophila ficusphila]
MQQSEHKNVKRPRSQSAPEYWILERVKSENTNSSYKSAISKHTASLFSRNPRKSPENVLVLQDETCESETDEYEMGGYTFCEMGNDCKETSQTTCSECKTADYSINANILKELKNQEESLNSTQAQDANCIPIDVMWTQQEQIRISPPIVLVPFRVNSQEMVGVSELKEWENLQLNLTMLNSNQLQMATETTKRILTRNQPNQNTPPSRGNGGHVYVNQEEKPMNSNLSTSVVQPHSKYEQSSYCTWTDVPMSERHEPNEESSPSHTRQKPTESEIDQTFHRIPEDRSISSTRYGPSFNTKHQRSKKDKYTSESRSSYRQPQGNQETYFEQPSSHSQSVYNYDRDNQDLHPRVHNSARYPTTQSNTTGLTWIKPDGNSEFVARSNATMSSTEVETLMQPRKLRSKKSTDIKSRETPIENSVLLETKTPCNRENLIETCGQPPSYFRSQQYTGLPPNLQHGFVVSQQTVQSLPPQVSMSAPQNTGENYIIDPRDQLRTVKSPVLAPVMQSSFQPHPGQTANPYQQIIRIYQPVQGPCYPAGLNSNHSGCQSLTENIKLLPPGFYDQTVRKYNITHGLKLSTAFFATRNSSFVTGSPAVF